MNDISESKNKNPEKINRVAYFLVMWSHYSNGALFHRTKFCNISIIKKTVTNVVTRRERPAQSKYRQTGRAFLGQVKVRQITYLNRSKMLIRKSAK